MGPGVSKNLWVKIGVYFCVMCVSLPQAYGTDVADPLINVSCPISAPNDRATGVLLGVAPVSTFALIMRASEQYKLRKKLEANQNIVRLLREFIAAQEALDATKLKLQAVYKEMLKIIVDHNLQDRILELKAKRLRTHGQVRIDFEELFGDKKGQPFASRYNSLTIERAKLESATLQRAGSPPPLLERKVLQALQNLKASSQVSMLSYDSSGRARPLKQARTALQAYETRAQKLAATSTHRPLLSNSTVAMGGVMIVAGVALFYSDEISYFFEQNSNAEELADATIEEAKILAANLKCLILSFEQQEMITPVVGPGAQKLAFEVHEVTADLHSNGMIPND